MKPKDFKEKFENEMFQFSQLHKSIHDEKFETKPIGYFKDAFMRFRKNKSSVVAAVIIIIVTLYGVLVPLVSTHDVSYSDTTYVKKLARSPSLAKFGIADALETRTENEKGFLYFYGIGVAASFDKATEKSLSFAEAKDIPYNPVKSYEVITDKRTNKRTYQCDVEVYYQVGFQIKQVSKTEYEKMLAWEKETGTQILYPLVDTESIATSDPNIWYKEFSRGEFVDNYLRVDGKLQYTKQVASKITSSPQYLVRILYYNYYIYQNGTEPAFLLGTDGQGYDIFVRLAAGIRLSLILSVCVSVINLVIGAIYGAVEGYYGGWTDLIMERISDILTEVPFIVVATLFQLHLVSTGKVSPFVALLFAFVLTGWLGTAYSVRTQFYRFKGQEYVLAARTLGAKDARIMFKHIFPNALGTIITSSVLVIPGVIFSESFLSYLGIVNLQGSQMTSLGAMLANGQNSLKSYPHIIFWPALVISLLMISFNLFGNGLRDAFNPSLRGTEE